MILSAMVSAIAMRIDLQGALPELCISVAIGIHFLSHPQRLDRHEAVDGPEVDLTDMGVEGK